MREAAARAGSSGLARHSRQVGGCLTCPAPRTTKERLGTHRAVGVQPGGGDADLGAETQLAAVAEAEGGADHHHGGADRLHESLRSGFVGGGDDFGVVVAVAADMGEASSRSSTTREAKIRSRNVAA